MRLLHFTGLLWLLHRFLCFFLKYGVLLVILIRMSTTEFFNFVFYSSFNVLLSCLCILVISSIEVFVFNLAVYVPIGDLAFLFYSRRQNVRWPYVYRRVSYSTSSFQLVYAFHFPVVIVVFLLIFLYIF